MFKFSDLMALIFSKSKKADEEKKQQAVRMKAVIDARNVVAEKITLSRQQLAGRSSRTSTTRRKDDDDDSIMDVSNPLSAISIMSDSISDSPTHRSSNSHDSWSSSSYDSGSSYSSSDSSSSCDSSSSSSSCSCD